MKTDLAPFALLAAFTAGESLAASTGESTIVLGETHIGGGSGGGQVYQTGSSVMTSVDVLGADKIEDQAVMNSWELLGQMPGIQMTETRQGGESGKVSFRAFNGEGYINGIKTLIDGVPSNVNSGNQRFIEMVFPLDLEYIEVVRGTNDPRYGLHNIAGNVNMVTRQGGNYVDSRLTYGSFNTQELQLATGLESGNFAQNYFLASQTSDGYRDHDTSEKYSLSGKWFYTDDEARMKLGLVARLYHHEADEAGFMTKAELDADRRSSDPRNANDGDDRDMKQLAVHFDWQMRDDVSLSNKVYYNSYKDDRKVTFSSIPVGDAPRQRRQWDEQQTGMLSNLTWVASNGLTLDGGLNVEHQNNEYRRYRYRYSIPTDFDAAPARVQNDDSYTLDNVGGYVQAVIQPTEALKIIPAMRVDRFYGETHMLNGEHADLQDYGWIRQPKFSVIYSLTPEISVYANWGRTFQILTGSTAPAYVTPGQVRFDPSINTGKEVGVNFSPVMGTEARIAVWQQDATDEVANMPSTGTSVGLGETRRRGIDLQFNASVTEQWSVWGSHSIQEAKVVSAYAADGQSLAGKEVFSTPRHISNLGTDYQLDDHWRFGLQARAQGDYYVDSLNEQGKYGGYALLDASVRYTHSDALSVDLQVKNLTDREYEYVWYDNFFWDGADRPMFSPAPGRTAFVSLNLKI
ncbi:TonB-dependent receptor [Pseudomonas putida]|uniref:TonB-dependent receptor n=1 Tax=Pseudomonas TaxID=286 RepID=UPI000C88DDA8|nr:MULTISPECIES: TonB-dependent receptor [unclassified Pseudomonas]PNA99359.1 TonB-dependent receptor [Pseudomonas sp. GW460-5]PNB55735.1 TonB-dependent receptor [Pseudomonas sp. FW305-130]